MNTPRPPDRTRERASSPSPPTSLSDADSDSARSHDVSCEHGATTEDRRVAARACEWNPPRRTRNHARRGIRTRNAYLKNDTYSGSSSIVSDSLSSKSITLVKKRSNLASSLR